MKNPLLILFCFLVCNCTVFGQQVDTIVQPQQPETTRIEPPKPRVVAPAPVKKRVIDSSARKARDTAQVKRRFLLRDSLQAGLQQKLRDSLRGDSLKKITIPVVKPVIHPAVKDTSTYRRYQVHPYLPLYKPAVFMLTDYRRRNNKDDLFYLMSAIILCLACIRSGFGKYFRNLFLLFFQTSLRHKQNREQLLQDNFASLLMNLLYFTSTGLYITLIIRHKHLVTAPFWLLGLLSAAVLVLIYFGKYIFLLFAGWVFNTREATSAYIFIVFMVNKVLGVALVPFLVLLSFTDSIVADVAITVSLGMIGLMFVYRYLVSFSALRNKLKVNALHFFLYLCAVEVLPLLLIYKVLINYIAGSF